VRKLDDSVRVWSAIETVVKPLGYSLSSSSGFSVDSRSYFRPLRFFSPPSTINVAFDEDSNAFRIKKIRVGSTKGASSWDIDSHVEDLREKLAAALPGLIVTVVTIKAEGQADLFPMGVLLFSNSGIYHIANSPSPTPKVGQASATGA
jgi:hypothetical protein